MDRSGRAGALARLALGGELLHFFCRQRALEHERGEDMSASGGHCAAIVRRGDELSIVNFALDPAIAVTERRLELR